MEEREKEDLYIPTYVTAQHEYFPGFGKKELYLTILMSAFVIVFSIILYGISRDLSIVVLTIMIGITACIGFNTRLEGNISMRAFVLLFIAYLKEQHSVFNHTGIRISWIRTECPSSELYCMELQADRFYQKRIYQHRYNEARSNYN